MKMNYSLVFTAHLILGFAGTANALDTPGVTKTEIVIGAHTAESGPQAGMIAYPNAFQAYINEVNAKGGVHGRKIKYLRVDAGPVAVKALDAAKKLVENDNIFAMVGSVTPAHFAVYKYLLQKGVPDLLFTDTNKLYLEPPQKLLFPAYHTAAADAKSSAQYIASKMPGQKACFIVQNNETGEQYAESAKNALLEFNKTADEKKKFTFGQTERVDIKAITSNVEVLKLKKENCQVVFALQFNAQLAQSMNYAFEQGFKPQWVSFQLNVNDEFLNLLNEGVREGLVSTTSIVRSESLDPKGDVWKKHAALMKKDKVDVSMGVVGHFMAEIFVEALQRAGADLTREKLVAALESMNGFKCEMCMMPLEVSATNHFLFTNPKVVTVKNKKWTVVN